MRFIRRTFVALLWLMVLRAFVCHNWQSQAQSALVAFTLALAFWSAHARVGAVRDAKTFGLVAIGGVWEIIVQTLFLLPVLILTSSYSCYTDRTKVIEVMIHLLEAKQIMTARIRANGKIEGSGTGIIIPAQGRLKAALALTDGIIVGAGEDPPVVLILESKYVEGDVVWTCRGFPTKVVPAQCRASEQKSN